jgi:hypothetical protein
LPRVGCPGPVMAGAPERAYGTYLSITSDKVK